MGGVQVSVVCACVCLMSSSSFLQGTLLPLYVYIRMSTDVPLSEVVQRQEYTLYTQEKLILLCRMVSLVAVEVRLMVRPWTYVRRRIEQVVYLEGKRKRT